MLPGILCFCLLCPGRGVAGPPGTDGLYLTLQTTEGEISAELFFELVPRTVGNLVGLVEGSRAWVDFPAARVRSNNFYTGLTFHRTIADTLIQTGSRNGEGTDGPGYVFSDEFVDTLRHDRAGLLSMANGGPDTNGSQFFVTLQAFPGLDDRNSVFGEVVNGLGIVADIANVATGTNDRPLVDVVVTNCFITRNGIAANAFNATAAALALPRVRDARIEMQPGPTDSEILLTWPAAVGDRQQWIFVHTALLQPNAWESLPNTIGGTFFSLTPLQGQNPLLFFRRIEVERFE